MFDIKCITGSAASDMDFGLLGHIAFGDVGLWAVQCVIGVDLWGTLVAYMVVIADIIQPAVGVAVADTGCACPCPPPHQLASFF